MSCSRPISARRGPARAVVFAVALAFSATAFCDDSAEPVEIRADLGRVEADGTSVLTGDVEITQGSLRLAAQRVTVATLDKRPHRIVATGSAETPVSFRQRIEPNEPFATGHAERIDYAVSEEELELKGNAFLSLGDREFAGDLIRWNVKDGRVDARANDPSGVTLKWLPQPTD